MIAWYWWVIGSAVLVAISNIIRKHILNHEHAMEQLAAAAPFRLLLILTLVPFIEIPSWHTLGLILVAASVLFVAMLYRNKSYRHMPISTVAPLNNFSPIFLLVIGVTLLGENLSLIQLAGIALVMVGGYALDLRGRDVLGPLRHAAKSNHTANVVVMLLFLSFIAAIDKTLIGVVGIPFATYLFFLYLFLAIISLSADYLLYGLAEIKDDIHEGGWWLFLASGFSFASIVLLYHAFSLPGVLVTLAIPIRRTSTLLEVVFGGKLFHEQGLARKAGAALIMVLGVLFIV